MYEICITKKHWLVHHISYIIYSIKNVTGILGRTLLVHEEESNAGIC